MIKVLLFAELQERAGKSEVMVKADSISVQELKEKYLLKYDMADLLAQAMLAVNEEYSEEDTVLKSGDTVAFIPPVSGG